MTAATNIADTYLNYLKQEGYVPQSTPQGIVFKREGLTFILEATAEDTSFLRLVLPNIWRVETGADLPKVLSAISFINANVKVIKGIVSGDQVSLAADTFLDTPESYKTAIARLLPALAYGAQAFGGQMRS